MNRLTRGLVVALAMLAAPAAFAPAASASIAPTVTLDQSAGTAAGSTVALGMDVKFAPTSSDSPKDLTVSLPAGLLANASIDGGACLEMNPTAPVAACQVGSGTVNAEVTELGVPLPVPVQGQVTFDLVAPPKPGDLAGVALFLTLLGSTSELGSPADVTVRPSSDPAGVGLNMAFSNIPDTYMGLSISVDELDATFSGLRMPASCPSTPANVTVSGNSYDDATTRSASAPLHVTACSSLPYAPRFSAAAAKDSTDGGVQVVTDIEQNAGEATSRTVALSLPSSVLTPNVEAVLSGGILCSDPTLASCKTIGSASATSPLYPKTLSGKTYLTGSFTAPAITIAFPAPFALTLSGTVNLAANTTTFKQLPDVPLTDLQVTLAGGPDAVFATTCTTPTGTASSTLTSQNGDRTITVPTRLTVSNYHQSTCAPPPGQGQPTGSGKSGSRATRPRLEAFLSGLRRGKPTLGLIVAAGTNAPKLRSLTIAPPAGLSFVRHRVHRRLRIEGVSIAHAKIRGLALRHGRLVVTLRSPALGVILKLGPKGLNESGKLRRNVRRRRIRSLKLSVVVRDATGKTTDLTARIKHLR